MSNFLDNFYGTIFSPNETFSRLRENPPLLQGFFVVLFISILSPLIKSAFPHNFILFFIYFLGIFFTAIGGVIIWIFFALFLDINSRIFCKTGKIKEILTLSAFALLPWIFIAPTSLIKEGGIFGVIWGALFTLAIWLWASILVIFAIKKTYDISFIRALGLAVIPFYGGAIAFFWLIGFFTNLSRVLL